MTTFYTSDQHFGHENIISYCRRPFENARQMDAEMVRCWNEVVEDDDTVWVLGDWALGDLAVELELMKLLHGHKILVSGNHDRTWVGHARRKNPQLERWTEVYLEAGFDQVLDGSPIYDHELEGWGPVTLSHFPIAGDSHGIDRYAEYRPTKRKDQYVLHGHVHNTFRWHHWPTIQLNVGVDVQDFTPVPSHEVVKQLKIGEQMASLQR